LTKLTSLANKQNSLIDDKSLITAIGFSFFGHIFLYKKYFP